MMGRSSHFYARDLDVGMPSPPTLLNDDGTASMASMFMMSHHGFRRDLSRFVRALSSPSVETRVEALQREWQSYRGVLHGHHQTENAGIFPSMRQQHPSLAACIDGLEQDHHRIDPLLERGDQAFSRLPRTGEALAVVRELQALLERHLATEEAELVPHLRAAKQFPAPATDAELEMFAQGVAWMAHGIAPDVVEKVFALLPPQLHEKLPAALAAFEARCQEVWGSTAAGSATSPIPNGP